MPSEDADRNRYIALQPLCLCCDRGPTVLGSIDRLLTFYLYGASFRITSHVRQKQREGDVPRRGSLLLGHRLILSPIVGTYYELWGLPLILNFIVCGMALLTFFRQYGALRLDRQTEKAQEADGMLLLSEYGITGFKRI